MNRGWVGGWACVVWEGMEGGEEGRGGLENKREMGEGEGAGAVWRVSVEVTVGSVEKRVIY
jgi:hypothetical protein